MKKITLQASIFERFMTTKDLEELLAKYEANKKGIGNRNRFESLESEVTSEELELLKAYFDKGFETTVIVAKKFNLNPTSIVARVKTIALRYLYQKGM